MFDVERTAHDSLGKCHHGLTRFGKSWEGRVCASPGVRIGFGAYRFHLMRGALDAKREGKVIGALLAGWLHIQMQDWSGREICSGPGRRVLFEEWFFGDAWHGNDGMYSTLSGQ
jgi:hypothetical protein